MAKNNWKRERKESIQQAKKFLVVVEGCVTEKEYIEAVKRSRQMKSVQVLVETGHTDPIGIVNKAKERKTAAHRSDPFDEVWCVFDTETKLTQLARNGLQQAMDTARRAKVNVALSNPCFEIWLLWHKQDQTGWISSDNAQSRCKYLGLTAEKHIVNASLLIQNYYEDAKARAVKLDTTHNNNIGTTIPAQRNPSSDMHKLIDSIYKAFPQR